MLVGTASDAMRCDAMRLSRYTILTVKVLRPLIPEVEPSDQ
jgi:hypothetical protein